MNELEKIIENQRLLLQKTDEIVSLLSTFCQVMYQITQKDKKTYKSEWFVQKNNVYHTPHIYTHINNIKPTHNNNNHKMYLRYYLDEKGNRIYTLKVVLDDGSYTLNAHPARFSPDDKFSKERIECKSRFGLLLTQVEEPKYWLFCIVLYFFTFVVGMKW